ncbi:MAG TPA: hypothetical protein VFG83_11750 [Kofleriaceae bacterium]|nr:hypothetical protein [Kofleriaceae bacterium]
MKAAFLAVGVFAMAAPAHADNTAWEVKLAVGSAFDSNVHRAEHVAGHDDAVDGAPLVRIGARANVEAAPTAKSRASLSAFAGAKAFAGDDASTENVGILASHASYDAALGDGTRAGVLAAYYDAIGIDGDATQAARSFRLGRAALSISLSPDREDQVSAQLGAVGFDYKPDDSSSFTGPFFGLVYRRRIWLGDGAAGEGESEGDGDGERLIDLETGYVVERRGFSATAYTDGCPPGAPPFEGCFVPTGISRRDLSHRAYAGAQLTGDRIYGVRYQVEVNDSNSFGQSLVRHRVDLTVTTELWGSVFATLRGTLRYNQFLDPLLINADLAAQSFVSIDEESRSGVSIHLLRKLGSSVAIEGRYAFSTSEPGDTSVSFSRHTAYLGILVGAAGS